MAAASSFGKTKNPTAGWQWGSINPVTESEPDCRAAQQQRVQQQVQIQITIHVDRLATVTGRVKWFFARVSVTMCLPRRGKSRINGSCREKETLQIMRNFDKTASRALVAIRQRAEELKIKGVAMVAAGEGDRIQSWSSKMLVVGSMRKGPSRDEPEMNLLAIVYSKAAEMADTLQASGSGMRAPLMGEYGWGGGVMAKTKTGYVFAAFSGGSSADDVKAAQAGLEILVKAMS